jgi:hypothetical protein
MIKYSINQGYLKAITGREIPFCESIRLAAAKNGGDSATVTLLSDKNESGISLSVGKCPEGVTCSAFLVHTLVANGEKWPDPLTELQGEIELTAGEYKSVYLRFDCGSDAVSGSYDIPVTVRDGEGKETVLKIELRVWNFELGYEFATAFGLDEEHLLPRFHGFTMDDKEKEQELYKAYYDYMLEHRVCAFDLPYDVLDPRADAYMSDPRVTSFVVRERISRDDGDEMLAKRCEKLLTNPEWMKKAYIYPFDEPADKELLDKIVDRANSLKKICPEMRQVSPFYADIKYDDTKDEITVLGEILEILCPKLACFNDNFIYNAEQKEKYPPFFDRMAQYQSEGKDLWSYVCWEPGLPYTNVFVNEEGLNHRVCFWQQFLCGCTGFLYWRVNYWDRVKDPWTDMATIQGWLTDKVHGDGSMLYNGSKVGIFGPCGSVRFEAVRAGIEDCEMLTVAANTLGREWVNEQIRRVTASVTEFIPDMALFDTVRYEIGCALEKALNK